MAFSKHGALKKIQVEKHMIMMIIAIAHGMVYCLLINTPPHPVPWNSQRQGWPQTTWDVGVSSEPSPWISEHHGFAAWNCFEYITFQVFLLLLVHGG